MTSDPRELVDRLDALADRLGALAKDATLGGPKEDKAYLEALRQGWADFIVIYHNALRAAVLRCAEMEAALEEWVEAQNELEAARPDFTGWQLVRVNRGYQRAKAALTAPQGEEQGT